MSLPLLFLKDINLNFGGQLIFNNLSCQIMPKDRICLIGRNGSGKSTFLKLLTKQIEADNGQYYIHPSMKISYLDQDFLITKPKQKIFDYIKAGLKQDETSYSYVVDIIIDSLALNKEDLIENLSGGTLRRANLARVLVSQPDLLLLDEPTNHLDVITIEWLEQYLANFNGSLICISHDRQFLKNISNKIFWLDRGSLKINQNNFEHFEKWSNQLIEQEIEQLKKLTKKIANEDLWLKQGVSARRKRNQGRLKNLIQLRSNLREERNNLQELNKTIDFSFCGQHMGSKLVIELKNINYINPINQATIIDNFSLRVLRGEKIGIIGKNGAGKSTLLKLIISQLIPTSGSVKLAKKLIISYSDQHRYLIDRHQSVHEALIDKEADNILVGDKLVHISNYLQSFLFKSNQFRAPVSSLSGGELNRLTLAKILANPGDLLILDEPTNDLDMDSLDILEEILTQYQGTLLIVSHDREFLERLVTRTLIFEDQKIIDFIGGYADYKNNNLITNKPKSKNSNQRVTNKLKVKLSYQDQRQLELLPTTLIELEQKIKSIKNQLSEDNFYQLDPANFNKLSIELADNELLLDQLESKYLSLLEQAESFG